MKNKNKINNNKSRINMMITLIMMNMKKITSKNHKRILMKENKMAKMLININNNSKTYKNNKEVKNNK